MRITTRSPAYAAALALALAGAAVLAAPAAAQAVVAAPPAGAAPTALMDFPSQFSEGFIVNVNSGKCLVPSPDAPLSNGDLVVQRTCDGTVGQAWELVPIGTKRFIPGLFFHVDHAAYRIVNAGTGLCLDDRDGVSSDGATVQEWECNTTSTTMQWGGFSDVNGNNLIANVRASNNRGDLISLRVASWSTADNVPVQLFGVPSSVPAAQEWVYNQFA
jgi:hypothetical protein